MRTPTHRINVLPRVLARADCGTLPADWGVANVGDLTNLTKTQPATALSAYGKFVAAVYNTTIG